jgi:hypothetical protein
MGIAPLIGPLRRTLVVKRNFRYEGFEERKSVYLCGEQSAQEQSESARTPSQRLKCAHGSWRTVDL